LQGVSLLEERCDRFREASPGQTEELLAVVSRKVESDSEVIAGVGQMKRRVLVGGVVRLGRAAGI